MADNVNSVCPGDPVIGTGIIDRSIPSKPQPFKYLIPTNPGTNQTYQPLVSSYGGLAVWYLVLQVIAQLDGSSRNGFEPIAES
jgi:hypothetical protein